MDVARQHVVQRLLMTSTSSVYSAIELMSFAEVEKADTPPTNYAATKKSNEATSHSYAHLWNLPTTTMFRFFTVYGTLERSDLALHNSWMPCWMIARSISAITAICTGILTEWMTWCGGSDC